MLEEIGIISLENPREMRRRDFLVDSELMESASHNDQAPQF